MLSMEFMLTSLYSSHIRLASCSIVIFSNLLAVGSDKQLSCPSPTQNVQALNMVDVT